MGACQWNGGPSATGVYRSLSGDISVAYCSDDEVNPPRGVLSGHDGTPSLNAKRLPNGEERRLPAFHIETCKEGECMVLRTTGGGGYGDPTKRDRERVLRDVNRQWLSVERAEQVYKVAVKPAANGVDYLVDDERTGKLGANTCLAGAGSGLNHWCLTLFGLALPAASIGKERK